MVNGVPRARPASSSSNPTIRRQGICGGFAGAKARPSVIFSCSKLHVTVKGCASFYSAVLSCPPDHPVTIAPGNISTSIRVSPSLQIFTPENWMEPQFFRVSAVSSIHEDSSKDERKKMQIIEHFSSSMDTRFNGSRMIFLPPTLMVQINGRDGCCVFATGNPVSTARQLGKPVSSTWQNSHDFTQIDLGSERQIGGLVAKSSLIVQHSATPLATAAAMAAVEAANSATHAAIVRKKFSRRNLVSGTAVTDAVAPSDGVDSVQEQPELFGMPKDGNALIKVACRANHTVLLYKTGSVVTLGKMEVDYSSEAKDLGSNGGPVDADDDLARDQSACAALSNMLVDVACGDAHIVAITEQGYLLSWGEGKDGRLGHGNNYSIRTPRVITSLLHKRIVHVACGARHTVALAEDGDVFSWGYGRCGALGHGRNTQDQSFDSVGMPMEILSLKRMGVAKISCGEMHTAIILLNGKLLTCGLGEHGRLGRPCKGGEYSSYFAPVDFKCNKGDNNKLCTYVACGAAHTLVLTECHSVYSFGWNVNGQLGLGDCCSRMVPTKISYFAADAQLVICAIDAGKLHSMALTQDARVFAWGSDELGQCGVGSFPQIYTIPHLVASTVGLNVTQIAAGEGHSVVLTTGSQKHLDALEANHPMLYAQLMEKYESFVKDDEKRRACVVEIVKQKRIEHEAAMRRRKPPLDTSSSLAKTLQLVCQVQQDAQMITNSRTECGQKLRPQTASAVVVNPCNTTEKDVGEDCVRVASHVKTSKTVNRPIRCCSTTLWRQTRLFTFPTPVKRPATAPSGSASRIKSEIMHQVGKKRHPHLYPRQQGALVKLSSQNRKALAHALREDTDPAYLPQTSNNWNQLVAQQSEGDSGARLQPSMALLPSSRPKSAPSRSVPRSASTMTQGRISEAVIIDDNNRRTVTPYGGLRLARSRIPVLPEPLSVNAVETFKSPTKSRSNISKKLNPTSTVKLAVLSEPKRSEQERAGGGNNVSINPGGLNHSSKTNHVPLGPVRSPITSNQNDNGQHQPIAFSHDTRPAILNNLAFFTTSIERGTRKGVAQNPTELPSQFTHSAHINISKWTVIVSDTTLFRIAARNKRITQLRQKQLLGSTSTPSTAPSSAGGRRLQVNDDAELTKSLIMNGAESITDVGLVAVAESVPALQVLEIANAVQITDVGLRTLAQHCRSLTRLNISNCRNVQGAGLSAIGDHCQQLTDLAVIECAQIGEWVLMRCIYAFTKLQHLNVARCLQITDNLLKTLSNQCQSLRTIILSDCTQVSDSGIVSLAQKCLQLERVALNRSQYSEKITDTACAALGEHCTRLKSINLAGCNFLTDGGIKWIADGCHELEHLDITNVFYVTDVSLRGLSEHCPHLKSIRLSNVKSVSDVGLRLLSNGCPELEVLHVSNLYLVSDGSNWDFGLEGLRAVAQGCKKLLDLNLSGCFQLVERSLVAIGASCQSLQKVNLKACPKITLPAVKALLRGCAHLRSLNLSGVLLCDNAMLGAISECCPSLKELYVAQCDKVSDNGLRHLAVHADQFEVLDFSGCRMISDTGVSALVDGFQHPALVHLYLAGCALITQDSIARIAFACPLLLTLSVHGCRVSHRVLQSLSSSWPFGVLRVPVGNAAQSSSAEMGIFPMHRAKDRRFVEEMCTLWVAAVKIQNLYRSKIARRLALVRKEETMRMHVARRLQSMWRGRKARREAMIKKLMRSGLEKSAIKIQRRYRETCQARRAQKQMQAIISRQLEKYVLIVQRRYRAKRTAKIARLIFAAKKKQYQRETQAAIQLQRRFRGIADRKRVNLQRIQRQIREKEEREASLRIQTIYRGRADRKKAKALERQKNLELELQSRRATQLQAQFRRKRACRIAEERREAIRERERAATKLQKIYRAKKGRDTVRMLQMANYQRDCQRAARVIQKQWRGRKDRIGVAVLREGRRLREERQLRAAIHLQRTFRRFLLRQRAQQVMMELLDLQQNAVDMEVWAATLVQSHWRQLEAKREVERVRAAKRTRWKQLVDAYNHHGKGYGAPFYFCDDVVHGRGKRQLHLKRRLFDFYGIRRDYGDGDFPSIWPSEIQQDLVRGYDFVNMIPTESYQETLWQIAQYVPVTTGKWDDPVVAEDTYANSSIISEENKNAVADDTIDHNTHSMLYREQNYDENGTCLWESFYDYGQQEYRYYHRISKRVVSEPPTTEHMATHETIDASNDVERFL